jgi:uncharacterized RDD family membrane protein YckC
VSPVSPTGLANPVTPQGSLRFAGLLPRFASLAYEAILLLPVLFIAAYLFLTLTHAVRTPILHALFQLWLLCVTGVYFGYCWRRGGQTLAMKTWRIRVARQDGSALSTREAIGRFVLAICSVSLLGLGFWWGFVDRERQFLHDRLIGSRIYRAQ